jgi:hypothetical protein
MFTSEGDIKPFGVGGENGKTVFSLGVFVMVLAIVSFYTFSLIDIIFK